MLHLLLRSICLHLTALFFSLLLHTHTNFLYRLLIRGQSCNRTRTGRKEKRETKGGERRAEQSVKTLTGEAKNAKSWSLIEVLRPERRIQGAEWKNHWNAGKDSLRYSADPEPAWFGRSERRRPKQVLISRPGWGAASWGQRPWWGFTCSEKLFCCPCRHRQKTGGQPEPQMEVRPDSCCSRWRWLLAICWGQKVPDTPSEFANCDQRKSGETNVLKMPPWRWICWSLGPRKTLK